ncbi:unnamed protein product [Soboliphyme baturini]|uniref:Hematopoietic cell signal transducer n=1 Tax=Soboliphyme baturini TaxID=241478 RepID=A0A183IJX5_9BILA|nr:unnamed protein product [Soboliphyme baturini]
MPALLEQPYLVAIGLRMLLLISLAAACEAYDESTGYIVGVVLGSAIGGIVFIVIVASLFYFFYLRKICKEMQMQKQEKMLGVKPFQKQQQVVVDNHYSIGTAPTTVVPAFTQSHDSTVLPPESPRFQPATSTSTSKRPVALQKAEQFSNSTSSKVSSEYSTRSVVDSKTLSAVYRDSAV